MMFLQEPYIFNARMLSTIIFAMIVAFSSEYNEAYHHSIGMNSRATHRYKMRAVGSRPSARPKHWQPVNGSQFIIKLYYRPTSSTEKNAFFLNQPTRFPCRGIRGIKRLFD